MSGRQLFSGSRPRLVIYPVLLAIAWVLNQGLATEAPWLTMVRPVLIAAGVAVLLTVLFGLALRNRFDGALLAAVVVLLVILPFPLFRWWQGLGPQAGPVIVTLAITGLVGTPLLIAVHARRHGRRFPRPSAGLLNGFAILLVLVVLATNTIDDAGTTFARLTEQSAPEALADLPPASPDIVIILLDGYPRADVLQQQLGIDNGDFLAALSDRDFEVAPDSYSNYVFTAATLASMFQMEYLDADEVSAEIGSASQGHDLLRRAAVTGRAFSTLKAAGYDIVTSPPGWPHVSLAEASDRVINDGHITQLEESLLEQTWALDLLSMIAPDAVTGSLGARLTGAFDGLDHFAAEERSEPAFVFLHVPAPHPPLLLDANGQLLPVTARSLSGNSPAGMGLTREEYIARWQGELTYLNKRVVEGIDRLQSANPDTVIVVMSDHGYGQEYDSTDSETRFANLFAAYTPNAPNLVADTPTPVNLMPRLLNRYLGTDFEERPDRYFMSPDLVDPLILEELSSPTHNHDRGTKAERMNHRSVAWAHLD